MAKHFSLKKAFRVGAIGLFSGLSGSVLASGFQNYDWSAASLGNGHAGSAARADDATTAFTNPAGLVFLNKHQATASGTFIYGAFDFDFTSGTTPAGVPMTAAAGNLGKLDDNPAVPAIITALHYSYPFSQNLAFGMSVGVPFGLATEYENDAVQRYLGTRSELITVDLNPSLSYRLNEHFALGAGVSAQFTKIRVKLNKMGDAFATCFAAIGPDPTPRIGAGITASGVASNDFEISNKADNWGKGFNVGVLGSWNATRVGLHFRSKIRHKLTGDTEFVGPGLDKLATIGLTTHLGLVSQNVSGSVDLPEIITLSLFHPVNEQWDVLADVARTNWDRFKKLTLNFEKLATQSSTQVQNYRDTWRASLGTNYHCNDNWTFRAGYMFDQSPVRDAFRTVRLPDDDRHWATVGVQYLTDSKDFAFDLGYGHVFFKRGIPLNEADPDTAATLVGKYDGRGDLLAAQVTWTLN